jgi:hypothetical protein
MFISKAEKNRMEENIKFLIKEVAALRVTLNFAEAWETISVKGKPLYKVPKKSTQKPVIAKKRGRPLGSKNKPK